MTAITANPLLSVIMPKYNYRHFISNTLASIQRQNYENERLIVFDLQRVLKKNE